MKERPILFSGEMVRAILAGRKTQTRRIVKVTGLYAGVGNPPTVVAGEVWKPAAVDYSGFVECPYGAPGDRLWVREAFFQFGHWEKVAGVKTKTGRQKWKFVPDITPAESDYLFDPPSEYRKGRHHKDPATPFFYKRLARFMPRKASRITLEIVTGRKVERLQSITEEDAKAEGCTAAFYPSERLQLGKKANYRAGYAALWESINGPGSWEFNPWVWVIEFRRI